MLVSVFGVFGLHYNSDDFPYYLYLQALIGCLLIASLLFLNLFDLHCAVSLPLVYLYTHTFKHQHTHNVYLRSSQLCYVSFLRPAKLPANVELRSVLQTWDSTLTHHHYGFLYKQPALLPLQSSFYFRKDLKLILQKKHSRRTFPCHLSLFFSYLLDSERTTERSSGVCLNLQS